MKRYTETNKWRDPWFQGLPHGSKLLFLYFCDNCDNAGFYEQNMSEACFHLRITESQYTKALAPLIQSGKLRIARNWLWITNFLRHQKNDILSRANNAHIQIIRLIEAQLSRFSGIAEFRPFLDPSGVTPDPLIGNGTGKEGKSAEKGNTALASRVGLLVGRRKPFREWSDKEKAAFRKLTIDEDRLAMLERYYGSERKKTDNICRRDLYTLLNNYSGEEDRALTWCEKHPLPGFRRVSRPSTQQEEQRPTEDDPEKTRQFLEQFERLHGRLPMGYERNGNGEIHQKKAAK